MAESSAGGLCPELTPSGNRYPSLTKPSPLLPHAGLATQRECLEIVGCYGRGKVNRLA